ncbi:hypothetical protein A2501_04230 [Candidatus Uhrbacteria bacterium RIFOXYC12_FULL_57_11]|nr:MAG: hypothetical protein A2501_04230 [Candidatus Uhrbacteria bacterium RIFOXYC12_FULL_57_11]
MTQVIFTQLKEVEAGRLPTSPASIIRSSLPESLRNGYDVLISARIPSGVLVQADRVVQQMRNQFFTEAANSLNEVLDAVSGNTGVVADLRDLSAMLSEEEQKEAARFEGMFRLQGEMYDAIKAAHPERVAQLDRRREIEVAFMYGEIVSPPVPLFRTPKGNSGSPHVAVVSHEGKRHRAIIKFGFSERFSRSGVVAGNGYWREVSGAMHAVGMGVDAPAVVSRRLDRYGPATLMEFLDGSSCEMVSNWFTDSDRRIHPEIFNIAANDWLTWRTDGAPRNLVTTIENTIAVIDFGSDFSTDLTVALSSAALYLVSKLDYEIPEEVRQCVREWGRSTERQIFDQIFALAPEDMSGYRRAYEVRLAQMLAAFDTMDRRIAFPPYSVSFRKDFGREFFLEFLRFGNT